MSTEGLCSSHTSTSRARSIRKRRDDAKAHNTSSRYKSMMMLASARSLVPAWRQQRAPLLAAARSWSASSASSSSSAASGTTATIRVGLFSNQRRGSNNNHEVVRFTGFTVGRGNPVAAPGGGRTISLRNVFVEATKKRGKTMGGGGGGGGGKGKKREAAARGGVVGDDDDDDFEDDFDDEDVVFEEEEDELMQTDENGELISTGDEDIDAEEPIFTAGTELGELALKSLEGVLKDDEFESTLEIFSFKVSTERRRIYISVDNVKDKFGSPTLDQLSSVSRKFNEVLEEAGFPDDVALEVASPGAERSMRLPGDLVRFRDLTMRVTYRQSNADADGQATSATKVMLLTDLDEEQGVCTWKLADVAENRPQAKKGQGMNKKQREWRLKVAFDDVMKANLFIDI